MNNHPVRHNGAKTAALLGLLSGVLLAVGGVVDGRVGLLLALGLALGTNGFVYFSCDKLALRAMRAQPVSEPQAPAIDRKSVV